MQVVIRSNHPNRGYTVTLSDGTKYTVSNIDDAIKLKEQLGK